MRATAGFPVRVALRQARQGALHLAPRRRPRRSSARFRIEQLPLVVHRGLLAPARRSASGWRCPSATRATPSTSTSSSPNRSTPTALAERLTPALPEGMPATGAVRADRACARPAGIDHRSPVPGRRHRRSRPARPGGSARHGCGARPGERRICPSTRTARARRAWTTSVPRSAASRSGTTASTPVLELTLLTQPRGARAREVLDALDSFVGVGLTEHRVPTNIPMDRTRRRAAGAAGSRRVRARPRDERIMREGTDVRRDDPGGDRRLRVPAPRPRDQPSNAGTDLRPCGRTRPEIGGEPARPARPDRLTIPHPCPRRVGRGGAPRNGGGATTGSSADASADGSADGADPNGGPKRRRRRGSRGGRNRRKPGTGAERADGADDVDDDVDDDDDGDVDALGHDYTDPAADRGMTTDDVAEVALEEAGLTHTPRPTPATAAQPAARRRRRPSATKPRIGDSRPRPRRPPTAAATVATAGTRDGPATARTAGTVRARRPATAPQPRSDVVVAADAGAVAAARVARAATGAGSGGGHLAGGGGGRQQPKPTPTDVVRADLGVDDAPAAELDDDVLERRRGRTRKGRPAGRYLMCVHVLEGGHTHIAVLEGRSLVEHSLATPDRQRVDRRQHLLRPGAERAAGHGGRVHRHRHAQERRALPR